MAGGEDVTAADYAWNHTPALGGVTRGWLGIQRAPPL